MHIFYFDSPCSHPPNVSVKVKQASKQFL